MTARARLIGVLAILLAGGVGIISSTQTWLVVVLDEPSAPEIAVSGATALAVLAPLSLATLALGLALTIVGTVLRYAFGVLTLVIAVALLVLTTPIVVTRPVSAVAGTVTAATGLAGVDAVGSLVSSIHLTPWPVLALAAWALLAVAGVLVLITARRWRGAGRRYRTAPAAAASASGPIDSIDSWDGLSRGEDPTSPDQPR